MFHEALRKAREDSSYSIREDFCRHTGVNVNTYSKYEYGERLPDKDTLNLLIERGRFPPETCRALRRLWNEALAEKHGLDLYAKSDVDLSALAERIQRDMDYSLKQDFQIKLSPKTRKAWVRRLEMRLRSALEET